MRLAARGCSAVCRAWSMACWVFLGGSPVSAGLANPAVARAHAVHGGLAGGVHGGAGGRAWFRGHRQRGAPGRVDLWRSSGCAVWNDVGETRLMTIASKINLLFTSVALFLAVALTGLTAGREYQVAVRWHDRFPCGPGPEPPRIAGRDLPSARRGAAAPAGGFPGNSPPCPWP